MSYCEVEDLLIGDIILPANVKPERFIQSASDEIDAKLGWTYKTPLAPSEVPVGASEQEPEFKHLPRHERLLIISICARLASGRLIMTLDTAGEQTTLHAYGFRLVKEALDELHQVANGVVELVAAKADPSTLAGVGDVAPSVSNYDDESLLLGFEKTVMKGVPWYSEPGSLS